MHRRWILDLGWASFVAVPLLALGVYGLAMLWMVEVENRPASTLRAPTVQVATVTYTLLTFPLAQSFDNLSDTSITRRGLNVEPTYADYYHPSRWSTFWQRMSWLGFIVDAWLYGLLVVVALRSARAYFHRMQTADS
ncbi:MAG: hypothetical protein AAGN64_00150 [Bacteroidota bacterium]